MVESRLTHAMSSVGEDTQYFRWHLSAVHSSSARLRSKQRGVPTFKLIIRFTKRVKILSQSFDGSATSLEDEYVVHRETESLKCSVEDFVSPEYMPWSVTHRLLLKLGLLSDDVPEDLLDSIASCALQRAQVDTKGLVDKVTVRAELTATREVVYRERDWRTPVSAEVAEAAMEEEVWEEGGGDGGGCMICREEFVGGERMVRLECGHCFHRDCVVEWLTRWKNSCPLCRFQLPKSTSA